MRLIITFCFFFIICSSENRPYFTEGGWKTFVNDIIVNPGPCNIDIVDNSLDQKTFLEKYAFSKPFILRDAVDNNLFRSLCRRNALLKDWGHSKIRLNSANSYSYDKREVSFESYVKDMMHPQRLTTPANETFYFFGDNDWEEWKTFLEEYKLPPFNIPNHFPALSFGLAGPGTGVPFHFHGPGFAETLIGRKRWFLSKPDEKPDFHPNKTTLQWYLEDYKTVQGNINISECTIHPGEVIFFPDKWWHATLNIDTSVFISTFLSP